jgi:hypothetical protein
MFKLLLCIGAVHAVPLAMYKLLDGTIKVSSPIVPQSASDSNSSEVVMLRRWVNDNTNAEAYYRTTYEKCVSWACLQPDQVNDFSRLCLLRNCSNKSSSLFLPFPLNHARAPPL